MNEAAIYLRARREGWDNETLERELAQYDEWADAQYKERRDLRDEDHPRDDNPRDA